ncbi:caspase family protein [bacterium]|nr:caspase family protein [bacterium]
MKGKYIKTILLMLMSGSCFTLSSQMMPEIVVQSSHVSVDKIHLSPDETCVASVGDHEIRIWDYRTAQLLAFRSFESGENIFWISEESLLLVHSHPKGWIEIEEWRWREDRCIPVKYGSEMMPWGVIKCNQKILVGYLIQTQRDDHNQNCVLELREAVSGELCISVDGHSNFFQRILGYNEREDLLVTLGESAGGQIQCLVWRAGENRIMKTIPIPDEMHGTSVKVDLTPDCKTLVFSGNKKDGHMTMFFSPVPDGRVIGIEKLPASDRCMIQLPPENDGVFFISNRFEENQYSICHRKFDDDKISVFFHCDYPMHCFRINKNKNDILIGTVQNSFQHASLTRYSYPYGVKEQSYGVKTQSAFGIYGYRYKDQCIIDVDEVIAQQWSVSEAQPKKQFFIDSTNNAINGFSISSNGEFVVQYSRDNETIIRQLESGETYQTLPGPNIPSQSRVAAVGNNGRFIITGDHVPPELYGFFNTIKKSKDRSESQANVCLWDALTGKKLFDLDYGAPAYKVGFSLDGRYCYATVGQRIIIENDKMSSRRYTLGHYIKIWETETGILFFEFPAGVVWDRGHCIWASPVSVIAMSENNQYLAFLSLEGKTGYLNVIDLSQKQMMIKKPCPLSFVDCAARPASLLFDGTSEHIILGTTDSAPYLQSFETKTGHVAYVFQSQMCPVQASGNALGFFNKDQQLVTLGQDNKVRIYNMLRKSIPVTALTFFDGNWISWAPNGYFHGSVEAEDYVGWKYKNQMVTFKQFKNKFYHPDVVIKYISGDAVGDATIQLPNPPSVKIVQPANQDRFQSFQCNVRICAQDDIEVMDIKLYINGKEILNDHHLDALEINRSSYGKLELTGSVALYQGVNKLTAVAYDNEGNMSQPAYVDLVCEKEKGNASRLFLIMIGIDRYHHWEYQDLKTASHDAVGLAQFFGAQEKRLYETVYVDTLINENATPENIKLAFQELPDMYAEDVIIIFMSGHGVHGSDGKYYFCTSESNPSNLMKSALSWADFEKFLIQLDAGKILLLLDTCHSGDILNRVPGDRFAEHISKHTAIVFTSCKGAETSFEDPELGHGLFTHVILDGLKGKADLKPDDLITMSELKTYVELNLPSLAKEYIQKAQRLGQLRGTNVSMTPYTPRLERYADFPIAVRLP